MAHAHAQPFSGLSPVPSDQQKLVQVGVVGVPNAGKSTLVNSLVGKKISAVSSKTNTTADSRLGAFTVGASQVVLLDTPGVVGPEHYHNAKHETRVKSAWKMAKNCGLLLFIVDAARQLQKPDPRVLDMVARIQEFSPPPSILVLNKVDAVDHDQKGELLPLADSFRSRAEFTDVFWVSALRGHGIKQLHEFLESKATPGRWMLEAGISTDRNEEDIALEITREKIFRGLYKELPYEIQLRPVSSRVLNDGSVRIEQTVEVGAERVRRMVVGKNGCAIGSIGQAARLELERMWAKRVHLFLNVKVVE